ncbi:MAG: hypothetical protein IPK78_00020 [Rhodospirillales bacterium]|nr:hypothetical protein [Rhodospirillales bacterium]
MTTPKANDAGNRVADAYSWAAGLVGLARRLVADGIEVDLQPIRPAIRDLCEEVKGLPGAEASVWLNHLIELQHEMATLARVLADRDRGNRTDAGDR